MRDPVSVIIPIYNAESFIEDQLKSLNQVEFPQNSEVVLVDNNTTDSTFNVVRSLNLNNLTVRIVEAYERAGVNYARNVGVNSSLNDNILIFDADDIVIPVSVERMIDNFSDSDFFGGGYITYEYSKHEKTYLLTSEHTEPPLAPDGEPFVYGGAMGVRKTLITAIGGFDESYIGGHDEVDLALRLRRIGVRAVWLEFPIIYYRQRNSLRGIFKQYFNYGRTSIQLVENFAPQFNNTVPGYKLLVRKFLHTLIEFVKIKDRSQSLTVVGRLGWATGRMYGSLIYRSFHMLPDRLLHTGQ